MRQQLVQDIEFSANIGEHDLGRLYWPSLETDYYDAMGEYSYETANDIIDEVIGLIDIGISDSNTEKIEKILDFIVEFIQYEADVNDLFHAPVETLNLRSGDCDDFSILGATLFEAVGIESAVAFFSDDQDEGHAMVLVHMNSLGSYGSWYYDDLTSLGLISGRWIEIEPQSYISEQDTNWFEQWSIEAAAALD